MLSVLLILTLNLASITPTQLHHQINTSQIMPNFANRSTAEIYSRLMDFHNLLPHQQKSTSITSNIRKNTNSHVPNNKMSIGGEQDADGGTWTDGKEFMECGAGASQDCRDGNGGISLENLSTPLLDNRKKSLTAKQHQPNLSYTIFSLKPPNRIVGPTTSINDLSTSHQQDDRMPIGNYRPTTVFPFRKRSDSVIFTKKKNTKSWQILKKRNDSHCGNSDGNVTRRCRSVRNEINLDNLINELADSSVENNNKFSSKNERETLKPMGSFTGAIADERNNGRKSTIPQLQQEAARLVSSGNMNSISPHRIWTETTRRNDNVNKALLEKETATEHFPQNKNSLRESARNTNINRIPTSENAEKVAVSLSRQIDANCGDLPSLSPRLRLKHTVNKRTLSFLQNQSIIFTGSPVNDTMSHDPLSYDGSLQVPEEQADQITQTNEVLHGGVGPTSSDENFKGNKQTSRMADGSDSATVKSSASTANFQNKMTLSTIPSTKTPPLELGAQVPVAATTGSSLQQPWQRILITPPSKGINAKPDSRGGDGATNFAGDDSNAAVKLFAPNSTESNTSQDLILKYGSARNRTDSSKRRHSDKISDLKLLLNTTGRTAVNKSPAPVFVTTEASTSMRSESMENISDNGLAALLDIFDDIILMNSSSSKSATNKVIQQQQEIPWPVKKEAVVEGDLVLGGLMMVHEREDTITCGPVMPQGGIQALEAMLYTLDRLNFAAEPLLPNITLGAHILDDCDKDTYGLEMAVDFIKALRHVPIEILKRFSREVCRWLMDKEVLLPEAYDVSIQAVDNQSEIVALWRLFDVSENPTVLLDHTKKLLIIIPCEPYAVQYLILSSYKSFAGIIPDLDIYVGRIVVFQLIPMSLFK